MPTIQDYIDRLNKEAKDIETELLASYTTDGDFKKGDSCNIPQEPNFTEIPEIDCNLQTAQELSTYTTPLKSSKEDEFNLLKQCVDAIQDVSTKNQKSVDEIVKLEEKLYKLEQLKSNVNFYYEYHKARLYYFSHDTTPVNIPSLLSTLSSINIKAAEYSDAISISINYNFVDVKTFQLAQPSPF